MPDQLLHSEDLYYGPHAYYISLLQLPTYPSFYFVVFGFAFGNPKSSDILIYYSLSHFLRAGPSLNLKLACWLGCMASLLVV